MIEVVRDSSLLDQVLCIYQDKSFSMHKTPTIVFKGEDGCDAGGLSRDFFSSTMKHVYAPHF